LLLYALVLLGLLEEKGISILRAGLIGFVAGLAVLNRFDAVLLPVPVALAVGWLTRSPSRGAVALAASAVAVSPWAAYSLAHFGAIFATDNAGIAAALDPRAYVTDWWPTPQPSLTDDPVAWAGKVAGSLGMLAYVAAGLMASALGLVVAAFLAAPAALAVLCRKEQQRSETGPVVLAGFAVLMALMLAPQVLTGYLEHRYFSAAIWAALLAAGCLGIAQSGALCQRMIFAKCAGAAAVLAVAGLGIAQAFAPRREASDFDAPADVAALQTCLAANPRARVLVIGDDTFAARAGAQGGLAAMMAPRNMAEGRLDGAASRTFAQVWRVDYILAADPARSGWVTATFPVEPVAGCTLPLYRLAR
jgi:hypothetical protein